jgi:uncharacterized membrane protein
MKLFASSNADVSEITFHSVSNMLFTYGLIKTLDYFCTISVFSID